MSVTSVTPNTWPPLKPDFATVASLQPRLRYTFGMPRVLSKLSPDKRQEPRGVCVIILVRIGTDRPPRPRASPSQDYNS